MAIQINPQAILRHAGDITGTVTKCEITFVEGDGQTTAIETPLLAFADGDKTHGVADGGVGMVAVVGDQIVHPVQETDDPGDITAAAGNGIEIETLSQSDQVGIGGRLILESGKSAPVVWIISGSFFQDIRIIANLTQWGNKVPKPLSIVKRNEISVPDEMGVVGISGRIDFSR